MKANITITAIGILVLISSPVQAELVELDLLALGCPQEFPGTWTYWESDFDLEVTFSEISHVYIDWAGGITAGLTQDYHPVTYEPIGDPYPLEVAIYTYMGNNPGTRSVEIWGGVPTYPEPEPFDSIMEIELSYPTTWSDLLDGQGTVIIGYESLVFTFGGGYIEKGNISLNEAILIVEGSVIPEPATSMLLMTGLIVIYSRNKRKRT